jgi:alkylation response protein AidB-like acyl-CoA dehydrogenase
MALTVVDRAMQGKAPSLLASPHRLIKSLTDLRFDCTLFLAAHGAEGLSQDTVLASLWAGLRTLRFADGPDEVHIQQIGKAEVKRERIIREASARVEGMRQALESGAAVTGVKSML